MRSNITPTDNEITVKAEIANIIGGIIWPNNHLSIKGMEYQGAMILFKAFLITSWFESFKRNLFNFYYLFSHYKIWMFYKPKKIFIVENFNLPIFKKKK